MFTETFKEVIKDKGVVSVTSWANNEAHVANTWNDYIVLKDDNKMLIPAAWFNKTQENTNINNRVIVTLGNPNIQGLYGMGTGYVVEGTANFVTDGADYDMMKEKFPFLTSVLEITVTSLDQKA